MFDIYTVIWKKPQYFEFIFKAWNLHYKLFSLTILNEKPLIKE